MRCVTHVIDDMIYSNPSNPHNPYLSYFSYSQMSGESRKHRDTLDDDPVIKEYLTLARDKIKQQKIELKNITERQPGE